MLQTLMALLDMFSDLEIEQVVLEPGVTLDKVDIVSTTKAHEKLIQVKSTIGRFTPSEVGKWAQELRNRYPKHDALELRLVGHASPKVKDGEKISGVQIKVCFANEELIEGYLAQKIGEFLQINNLPDIGALNQRKLLDTLYLKFFRDSTKGRQITRTDLKSLAINWVNDICSNTKPKHERAYLVCDNAESRRPRDKDLHLISHGGAAIYLKLRNVADQPIRSLAINDGGNVYIEVRLPNENSIEQQKWELIADHNAFDIITFDPPMGKGIPACVKFRLIYKDGTEDTQCYAHGTHLGEWKRIS